MKKIILDLCGGTGGWSKPYKEAGYDVRVITWPEWDARLYPSGRSKLSRNPAGFADITDHEQVYGILAAPVCTVFSGSGAVWKRSDDDITEALSLVDACIRIVWVLKPKFWAMENPVGKLRKWIGEPAMSFQPCDYGDPYTKKTLLWGDFNTNLIKNPVEPEYMTAPNGKRFSKMHWFSGGKSDKTKEKRSVTPKGFAEAFFNANP